MYPLRIKSLLKRSNTGNYYATPAEMYDLIETLETPPRIPAIHNFPIFPLSERAFPSHSSCNCFLLHQRPLAACISYHTHV